MTTTTIKVSKELRDRINADARRHGLTAAGFIAQLLEDQERAERMAAFGAAMASIDDDYLAEVRVWDTTASDGLTGD